MNLYCVECVYNVYRRVVGLKCIIGVSLSKPHIDCDDSPHMYVCMYVCMYVSNILTHVCHTLVPEIHVRQ